MKTAVLLHLGYRRLWGEIRDALGTLNVPFDLYVNLVEGMDHEVGLADQKKAVSDAFPDATILVSGNKGMDTSGMLRMFKLCAEHEYDLCLYLHSKSNDVWRRRMISSVIGESERIINEFTGPFDGTRSLPVGMAGSYLYPFDYYNIRYVMDILAELKIQVGTTWERYHQVFPETVNFSLDQLVAHSHRTDSARYRPQIDLRYYTEKVGAIDTVQQQVNPDVVRQMIDDGVMAHLPYYPGNFFWVAGDLLRELDSAMDLSAEIERLPGNLYADRTTQSRAHAWERVLPIFALKKGYRLFRTG